MEKQMAEVIAENKRLTEPLQKAREEVEDLRRQLTNYEKDKEMLRVRDHDHLYRPRFFSLEIKKSCALPVMILIKLDKMSVFICHQKSIA